MKLPFAESLSPKLVPLLRDLFPKSESALRNGLIRAGDRRILDYAAVHDFVLLRPAAIRRSSVLVDVPAVVRRISHPTDTQTTLK